MNTFTRLVNLSSNEHMLKLVNLSTLKLKKTLYVMSCDINVYDVAAEFLHGT